MSKSASKKTLSLINPSILIGTAALLLSLVFVAGRQARPGWHQYSQNAAVQLITPILTGEPELCLTCHAGIEEISEAHPVDAFGCVICHGGDRLSLDEELAHQSLTGGANPSSPESVEQGCGGNDCHSGQPGEARDHIARIESSLHSSYAGALNQIIGNESGPYYGLQAISDADIQHPEAVGVLLSFELAGLPDAFSENCLSCHLGAEAPQESYAYRSTGCAACHIPSNNAGYYLGGDPTIPRDEPGHIELHRLTTQIPFTQCNTCHNRGNYSVEELRFTPRSDLPAPHELPADPTGYRLAQYYPPGQPFTRCEWELDCIDCHTTDETMGSRDITIAQSDSQQVQCKTCHGTPEESPAFITIDDSNHPAVRRAILNPHYDIRTGTEVLLAPDGDTLGAVQRIGESIILITKVSGRSYSIPQVIGSDCEQDGDQQEADYCRECHAYAP